MKIALVKRRCSLRAGGSERYCVNLARQLMVRGHDVTVIGESIDDDLSDEIDFVRVPVVRWTSSTRNRSFAMSVAEVTRRRDFDIVYGLGRAFGLDAVRVTERLQSHWLTVRYRSRFEQQLQHWNPRHRTLIDLERTIYNSPQVRRIVTQSRLDQQLVSHYYGVDESRVRIIHNGVDLAQFHPASSQERLGLRSELRVDSDQPLLVFASMDFEGKGLRTILRALSRLESEDAVLAVLGTGPIARFQRIARRLGLEQRVRFVGRRADIRQFYGAGDLFLLPTAYEPFPNVNLEAMACGLPVLTTCTAGGVDLVRHGSNGYLVADVDAEDEILAALQAHLSLSADKRSELSRCCLETARTLPIERNVQQTLELFEEVLDDKRAA